MVLSLPSVLKLLFTERKKQPTPVKEIERKDEEEWSLKDVVFVEDSKTLPVGKVIKVKNFFGRCFLLTTKIIICGVSFMPRPPPSWS